MPATQQQLEREWRALPLVTRSNAADDTDSTAGAAPSLLSIDAEALVALRSVRAHNIHVLGVFGPPNTGKRLFLRTLLRSSCDFEASPPDTRVLLWLWLPVRTADAQPDTVERATLVISSGSHADETASDRKQRLALLLLLSSALVYNEDGEINAQAIERLDWLADVAHILRVKATQDDAGVVSDFQQHAPKLVWLVQNVKVKWLTAPDGAKLTPQQYLERNCADEPGYSDAVAMRNERRMYLHMYFGIRDCVALSRPLESVTAIASPTTPRDALRSPFVDAIDKFYNAFLSDRATSGLPAKQVMGHKLCNDELAVVLEVYVDALNSARFPTIALASSVLLQRSIDDAFAAATRVYDAATVDPSGSAKNQSVATAHALQIAHHRGVQQALAALRTLRAQLPASLRDTTFSTRMATWRADTQQQLAKRIEANNAQSAAASAALLATLLPHNLDAMANDLATKPRESFADGLASLLSQYKSDLQQALRAFAAQAVGPLAATALEHALLQTVRASIVRWSSAVLTQFESHVSALTDERESLTREVDAAKMRDLYAAAAATDQQHVCDTQLATATQQLSALRSKLRGDLATRTAARERLESDRVVLERKHAARLENAASDVAWTRSRTDELARAALAASVAGAATADVLSQQRSLHDDERALRTSVRDLLVRVAALEQQRSDKRRAAAAAAVAHERAIAACTDNVRTAHDAIATQWKAQFAVDTEAMRSAFDTKCAATTSEIASLVVEIDAVRAQLAALVSPVARTASAVDRTFFAAMALPMGAVPVLPPADDGDAKDRSSSSSAVKAAASVDVATSSATIGPNPATRAALRTNNSALCTQS